MKPKLQPLHPDLKAKALHALNCGCNDQGEWNGTIDQLAKGTYINKQNLIAGIMTLLADGVIEHYNGGFRIKGYRKESA